MRPWSRLFGEKLIFVVLLFLNLNLIFFKNFGAGEKTSKREQLLRSKFAIRLFWFST